MQHTAEQERKSTRGIEALPTSAYFLRIFPSLTAPDLMRMKRVSRNFKLLSDAYIKQTAGQIFYAVSWDCQVEIGTRTMRGCFVTDNINSGVSGSQLIHAFKYEWDTSIGVRSNQSMWIFRTEIEALKFLTPPRAPALYPSLYNTVWLDDRFEKARIQVTPVYKVQLVHANICYNNDLGRTLVNVQEFKENDEHHRRACFVRTANLLPLSATVKVKFFQRAPFRTIAKNVDLKKIEPEIKSAEDSLVSSAGSTRDRYCI